MNDFTNFLKKIAEQCEKKSINPKSIKMKIYLTGFMGAGKSRLGKGVAQKLSVPFIDTDLIIENKKQKSVADIFATDGEAEFRRLESLMIKDIAASPYPFIVALGGGTLTNENNYQKAANSGVIIYIKSSAEEILKRVNRSDKRPLLKNKYYDEKLKFIKSLLTEREQQYLRANIIFERDGFPLEKLIHQLETIIKGYYAEH
jgi:shikimate kinase